MPYASYKELVEVYDLTIPQLKKILRNAGWLDGCDFCTDQGQAFAQVGAWRDLRPVYRWSTEAIEQLLQKENQVSTVAHVRNPTIKRIFLHRDHAIRTASIALEQIIEAVEETNPEACGVLQRLKGLLILYSCDLDQELSAIIQVLETIPNLLSRCRKPLEQLEAVITWLFHRQKTQVYFMVNQLQRQPVTPPKLHRKLLIGVPLRLLLKISEEEEVSPLLNPLGREPGLGVEMVRKFLEAGKSLVDSTIAVVLLTQASPRASLNLSTALTKYQIPLYQLLFTDPKNAGRYLQDSGAQLFLTNQWEEARQMIPSGVLPGEVLQETSPNGLIRIAFDGNLGYGSKALQRFLRLAATLQREAGSQFMSTCLVSTREPKTCERLIRSLEAWNVPIDEAVFNLSSTDTEQLRRLGVHLWLHC